MPLLCKLRRINKIIVSNILAVITVSIASSSSSLILSCQLNSRFEHWVVYCCQIPQNVIVRILKSLLRNGGKGSLDKKA